MQGKRLQSKVESAKEGDSSPGRTKRYGKPATERASHGNTGAVPDVTVQDQKRRRRLQDPLPLEVPLHETVSKSEHEALRKGSDSKSYNSSKPTNVPHHDERNAVSSSRNVRRRPYPDHGSWSDSSKGRITDRYGDRADYADVRGRENRAQVLAKEEGSDKVWRHDGFFELEANEPQERRRPAFRETKVVSQDGDSGSKTAIAIDKRDGYNKVADSIKREGRGDANERHHEIETWSERVSEGGWRGRDNVPRNEDVERGRWLERDPHNDRFQYRGRFSSSLRGRERPGRQFDGSESNQLRSRTFSAEKWKHDLFDQANRSPTPKTEEDQIAKIEALLAT
jgi:hypothetical protein